MGLASKRKKLKRNTISIKGRKLRLIRYEGYCSPGNDELPFAITRGLGYKDGELEGLAQLIRGLREELTSFFGEGLRFYRFNADFTEWLNTQKFTLTLYPASWDKEKKFAIRNGLIFDFWNEIP